jgi:hypothetical protein
MSTGDSSPDQFGLFVALVRNGNEFQRTKIADDEI